MPSCLGIYIEKNIIKYAKVSKDRETVKIEASGVRFYENVEETVKQIVNETFSFKTPISINLSDEKYTYTDVFSLLSKKDLEKTTDTEFEYFCNENGKNKNALEYRKIFIENSLDKDKKTVLYPYIDKAIITSRMQIFEGTNLSAILPMPIAIANLNNFKEKKNSVIVNIEKNTSITTIIDGEIYKVDILEQGMQEILENIVIKENSYEKAYEICKNSTIYTTEGKTLEPEANEYMEDIMPTLYSIVQKVKESITMDGVSIENIYITGLGSVINNIDLYFQENFINQKCEILVPYFVQKSNIKINIKDYIEVNSAIALALQGLGEGNKEINFTKQKGMDKLSGFLNVEKKPKKDEGSKDKKNIDLSKIFSFNLGTGSDRYEKYLMRTAASLLIIITLYSVFTKIVIGQIVDKNEEIKQYIEETNNEITVVKNYTKLVETRVQEYEKILSKLEENNSKLSENSARKNAIPNLLNNIMFCIPKEVQLLSLANSSGKHIKIEAQSEKYQQLGFFVAKLKTDTILVNVTSTPGVKENGVVKITIEGDLPY